MGEISTTEFVGPVRKRGQRSFVDIRERLKKYSSIASNGCIEWNRRTNKDGYGTVSYKCRSWLAHRLTWTLERGEIPDGMKVCHTCDNPKCINIDHLFLGSQADNVADMIAKGRGVSLGMPGETHPNVKLSAEDVAYIRNEIANRKHGKDGTNSRLARELNVSEAIISNIANGKRWHNF